MHIHEKNYRILNGSRKHDFQSDIEPSEPLLAEKNLLAAILARAVMDATGNVSLPLTRKPKSTQAEAIDWIFFSSLTDDDEFSFAGICETLEISPAAVRDAVNKAILADSVIKRKNTGNINGV